jgi:hypothetical protein
LAAGWLARAAVVSEADATIKSTAVLFIVAKQMTKRQAGLAAALVFYRLPPPLPKLRFASGVPFLSFP